MEESVVLPSKTSTLSERLVVGMAYFIVPMKVRDQMGKFPLVLAFTYWTAFPRGLG